MAQVVLLRGVNVGGHRVFRPAALAAALRHLDVVNIGAAGTFVVRARLSQSAVRAEFEQRLPFQPAIAICPGRDILALASRDVFADQPADPDIVRFVSVLCGRPRAAPTLPLVLPPRGAWLFKVIARDGRFVLGLYRRQMKAVAHLGTLDRLYGVPVTTRNWTTIQAIATALRSRDA